VSSDYYRKTFTANELPNLYSFYTFFKKNSLQSINFFKLVKEITFSPDKFSNMFLQQKKPMVVGTDEAFALSAKILDMKDLSTPMEFPKIVHLKPMIQNFPWPCNLVSNHVGLYLDKQGQLKIGNFLQENIVHYVEKDFITEENISMLELAEGLEPQQTRCCYLFSKQAPHPAGSLPVVYISKPFSVGLSSPTTCLMLSFHFTFG
jgi:hypothetical protein